ncbi:hypothetical protein H2204_011221 [Knufia peltigerae]|uniref:MFS transporter n=1 Tax=Knufia peltigerae TaxID=1002370 RepID=A0AA38XVK8_9EURO|nr:hypothetical protein H2204_011221 [Knufia peltigerae]
MCPYVRSDGEWIARCIVMGFFIAPIEALPEISVTDIYFTHQRGTWMGVYAFSLAGSNYFTPVVCGFIADRQGWEWVFYWAAIFNGGTLIFLFFFQEETNYMRKTVGIVEEDSSGPSPPSERIAVIEEPDSEKNPTFQEIQATRSRTQQEGEIHSKEKSFVQKLSLWSSSPTATAGPTMFQRALRSLKYLSWPVIFYAGFSYGSGLIWFNITNATASVILSGPTYNFSSSMVGLSYLSCCVGVIVGSLISGRLSDWLTIKLASRNGGFMEAEHRLWPFVICVVVIPSASILWGVGASYSISWVGLVFAMGMLAMTTTMGVSLSVNYLIDSYHDISTDALVTVILVRNTMSFAVSYGITPWVNHLGIRNCFISTAFVGMAASSVFLFMIWFGKRLRARSAAKYWKLVEADHNANAHR